MTDITELAQSKALHKKLNRRLNDAFGFQRTSGGKHTTISLSIDECKSVIAAFDERLALVEALEQAQAKSALVAGGIDASTKLHERIAELDAELEREREKSRRVMSRIAELESRTVNISVPDARNEDYDWDGQTPSEAFNTCRMICTLMFRQSLRAAGIKVEDE